MSNVKSTGGGGKKSGEAMPKKTNNSFQNTGTHNTPNPYNSNPAISQPRQIDPAHVHMTVTETTTITASLPNQANVAGARIKAPNGFENQSRHPRPANEPGDHQSHVAACPSDS